MLKIENLYKSYGKKNALNGINLEISQGETVVIMGPSGCGKSTLIRCINRLTEPTSGNVWLDGVELTELSQGEMLKIRRKIGFVFQHFNLIQRLNALDNVSMPLRLYGVNRVEAENRAEIALKKVGLGEKLTEKPVELSGGEQQRVGIARALVGEPEIMLWDEPTASLDPILVGEVLEVMEELVREGRTTMVIVTHELFFARKAAERIVFMDHGKVAESGPPEIVLETPFSEVGKRYHQLLRR